MTQVSIAIVDLSNSLFSQDRAEYFFKRKEISNWIFAPAFLAEIE